MAAELKRMMAGALRWPLGLPVWTQHQSACAADANDAYLACRDPLIGVAALGGAGEEGGEQEEVVQQWAQEIGVEGPAQQQEMAELQHQHRGHQ